MVQFHLLAFVPFGVFIGTALIAAVSSIWISFAHGSARRPARPARARPTRDAQILYFPAPVPRRRPAREAARQPGQLAVYARTPLAG